METVLAVPYDEEEQGEGAIELFAPDFAPFTVALIVMLTIGAIELLSLLIGFSPSASIESTLPIEAIDIEAPELSGAEVGPFSQILSWFSVGRVPFLVLMVIALTAFAICGYAVQWATFGATGSTLAAWIAAIPALIGAGYATRHLGRWFGDIFPRDHSEAASRNDLVGSYATIIRGEAKQGQPAEAKTTDLRGRTHYVLLEPGEPGMTYSAGARVFLVGRDRNVYRAITRLTPPQE